MKQELLTIDEQFNALGWKKPEWEGFPKLVLNSPKAESLYQSLKTRTLGGGIDMDVLKITSNQIQEMLVSNDNTEVLLEDTGNLMLALEVAAGAVKPHSLRDERDYRRLLIPKNFTDKGSFYSKPDRKPFYFYDYDRVPDGHLVADLVWDMQFLTIPGVWGGTGAATYFLLSPLGGDSVATLGFFTGFFASIDSIVRTGDLYRYLTKTKIGRKVLWGGNNVERR